MIIHIWTDEVTTQKLRVFILGLHKLKFRLSLKVDGSSENGPVALINHTCRERFCRLNKL